MQHNTLTYKWLLALVGVGVRHFSLIFSSLVLVSRFPLVGPFSPIHSFISPFLIYHFSLVGSFPYSCLRLYLSMT